MVMTENTFRPELNSRLPFMKFNWPAHAARVHRLTLAERGLLDMVRCELWTVVGCKMPRPLLLKMLRIEPGAPDDQTLSLLIDRNALVERDGFVFCETQVHEFAAALAIAERNRESGKLGGRPRRKPRSEDNRTERTDF